MRTIGFINWKGGVGKTTCATNAAYLMGQILDAKVLFIDLDKQGNASTWFGADTSKGTVSNIFRQGTEAPEVSAIEPMAAREVIQKTRYSNIDLIASDASLLDINLALLTNKSGRQDNILINSLREVSRNYDICLIDNPPDSNITVLNGIELADDIIAVTLPNRFSVDGIDQLESELENYNEVIGLSAKIRGIVINKFTSTTGTYKIVDYLKSKYQILPHIRTSQITYKRLDDCINQQKSIYELSPRCQYARDLKNMISYVVEKW